MNLIRFSTNQHTKVMVKSESTQHGVTRLRKSLLVSIHNRARTFDNFSNQVAVIVQNKIYVCEELCHSKCSVSMYI